MKARRTRLGAGPEKEVRRNVEAEILGGEKGMRTVDLLREVGAHPAVEEDVRRAVEIQEFAFWRKLVGCITYVLLPAWESSAKGTSRSENGLVPNGKPVTKRKPSQVKQTANDLPVPSLFQNSDHPKPTKQEASSRADGLANGFILLGIDGKGAEEGWSWVLEGKDEPTLCTL